MVSSLDKNPNADLEDRILKVGYLGMLQARHPLNNYVANSNSPEDAYFLGIEQDHYTAPEELHFQAIKEHISPDQQARIEAIWNQLVSLRREVDACSKALHTKWTKKIPKLPTPNSDENRELKRLIRSDNSNIRRDFHRAAITSLGENTFSPAKSRQFDKVEQWRREEKGLRESFYRANKNYLTALRLYYAMLVEVSPDGEKKTLITEDPSLRAKISIELRYVEVIDASIHGMAAAKAAHHEQSKGRIRKTKQRPYISHIQGVTQAMLLDVLPFVIEEEKLPLDIVLYAAGLSLHDSVEDTDLSVDDAIGFLRKQVDSYDSSLDPVIVSIDPAQRPRKEIKARVLTLMGSNNQRSARRILRIISNNTELTDLEKKKALQKNIAGEKSSLEGLGLEEYQYKAWGIDKSELPAPLTTFTTYPEDYDKGKMTKLLLRMHAIADAPKIQQAVLVWKLEDRANNLGELEGMKMEKQLANLRGTTTRLLAYCMLDHNQVQSPLYNALPRCIDVTLEQYYRLRKETPTQLEDFDHANIKQLEAWSDEVIRWENPEDVQTTLDAYNDTLAA